MLGCSNVKQARPLLMWLKTGDESGFRFDFDMRYRYDVTKCRDVDTIAVLKI